MSAWSRGDLDASLAEMHQDIEWHVAFRLPDLPPGKDVFHGHDEVRRLWTGLREVWDEITLDIEEELWESKETALVRVRFRGTGGSSGIEVDRVLYYVLDVEDELLRRIRPFDDEAEARRAAGAPSS